MMHYKYTNKNELPVPKYKEGQRVWKQSGSRIVRYSIEYTTIRKVLPPRWVDYGDKPHWVVEYRHQPMFNERMVQFPIEEEELYDTEADAVKAAFDEFYNDTCRQLGNFKEKYKSLGISDEPMLKMIENNEKA